MKQAFVARQVGDKYWQVTVVDTVTGIRTAGIGPSRKVAKMAALKKLIKELKKGKEWST